MSIPESAVTPAEMQAWSAIFETSNIVQYAADRELRGAVGLSLAQFEILVRIAEGPDAARRMPHAGRAGGRRQARSSPAPTDCPGVTEPPHHP